MARLLDSIVDRATLERIEPLCLEFERLLQQGAHPSIEEFAARITEADRPALTLELAGLEIEHRRTTGERPTVEEYRERFGELAELLRMGSGSQRSDGTASTRFDPLVPLPPLFKGQWLGPYQIEKQVGYGAFGEVWKARDHRLMREVAIKTPRSDVSFTAEDLQRFTAEAQRVAQLRHPNIAAVFDVGHLETRPYLVYEFIDGEPLRAMLARDRLDQASALPLFTRICAGVECAHAAGIVHRDLKPGNIIVDRRSQPHVVDFGMAKMPTAELTVVGTGEIAGTPQYMSPEQAAGANREITPATDVYALGVILFELLTGRRPFQATSSDLLRLIREEPPPPLREFAPDIDRRLEEICTKAMAKRPSDRYATAGELGQAVEQYLGKRGPGDDTLVIRRSSHRRLTRRSALIGVGMAAAALSLALIPISKWLSTPKATINVRVTTSSDPARVVLWKVHSKTNEPDPDKRIEGGMSPVEIALEPGRYLVVAALPDGQFHEVYRTVPEHPETTPEGYLPVYWVYNREQGVLNWPRIEIPGANINNSMVLVDGAEDFLQGFAIPDNFDPEMSVWPRFDAPPFHVRLPSFWIDKDETTWAEYRRVLRRGPDSWRADFIPPADDEPVVVTWPEAMDFAERIGKRLMTEAEYEYVASNRGTTLFPWGEDSVPARSWSLHAVTEPGIDVTSNPAGVRGLYSNAGEWTLTSMFLPPATIGQGQILAVPRDAVVGAYIVRGFVPDVASSVDLKSLNADQLKASMTETSSMKWTDRGVRLRRSSFVADLHGIRCVRSAVARLERKDLQITQIEEEPVKLGPR